MRLDITFYSKNEMAIHMDFSGRYPFPETETNELFLLACILLRQLNNLGGHVVAKALAGLLVSNESIAELFNNSQTLPLGEQLLYSFKVHAASVVEKSKGKEESTKVFLALDNQLNYNDAIIRVLDNDVLASMPSLINYKGRGRKSFEITIPPFMFSPKGFGFLGLDVNYYSLHSVTGLIRFLGNKHVDNNEYKDHLVQVAQLCGTAYIFQQIPPDQLSLANKIIKTIGI